MKRIDGGFEVTLDGEFPPSKKNGTVIAKTKTGRYFVMPAPKVKHYQKTLHEMARLQNPGKPPLKDGVHLEVVVDYQRKIVDIFVEERAVPGSVRAEIDQPLSKVGGKKLPDLVNMLAVIADALEGVAFENDRQIVSFGMRWY